MYLEKYSVEIHEKFHNVFNVLFEDSQCILQLSLLILEQELGELHVANLLIFPGLSFNMLFITMCH